MTRQHHPARPSSKPRLAARARAARAAVAPYALFAVLPGYVLVFAVGLLLL
jgi:hypothetical protein